MTTFEPNARAESQACRHKYDYKVDPTANTAAAKVVRMTGKDKRVLEIGAGPGSITRLLKEHGNCRVTAIEVDDSAIEKLAPYCEQVYRCDLNDRQWVSVVAGKGRFQAVVAADVLEHLYDPWATLRAIKEVLDEDGYVVVSLPHVGHNAVIACLFAENFEYQDWGLLDRTHIRFFGIKNIEKLFSDSGFKITEAEFVVVPPERTELANSWRKAPTELRRKLEMNRFGMVYQVVVKAKVASMPGAGLKLSSLVVPGPTSRLPPDATVRAKATELLRVIGRSYLSPQTRTRLRRLLDQLTFKR